QLEPHQEREDPADGEEGEGVDQVEDPDALVVGGGEPLDQPAARAGGQGPGRGLDHGHRTPPPPIMACSRCRCRPWPGRGHRTGSSTCRGEAEGSCRYWWPRPGTGG